MFSLLLVLFGLAVVLTAVLWLGSLFFQGYFYTEPSGGLHWQAPAAAAAMTFFFLFWSLLNLWGATKPATGKAEIPYGLPWEFSNRVYVVAEPVPRIESKKLRGGESIYELDRTASGIVYKKVGGTEQWSASGVEYVKFTYEGQLYKLVRDKDRETGYAVFVDADRGLDMKESEIGRVGYTSFGRLLVYFFLNVLHLVLWFGCFALLLRYQLSHALALAVVMWFVFTLTVTPGLWSRVVAAVG